MYIREKIESELRSIVEKALDEAKMSGVINLDLIPQIMLEVPRETEHGDYSTNIAMQLPKLLRMPPLKIAELILANTKTQNTYVEKIEIAGPGFINFRLKQNWVYEVLKEIDTMGGNYGKTEVNTGKTYNLEFVSANPTGPMHMGNARGGAIGDILASIAEWTGYKVIREFYVNDAGNQIAKFGESLDVRFRQLMGEDISFPEDGYQGNDITEHMQAFIEENGGVENCKNYLELPAQERKSVFVERCLKINLTDMKAVLKNYNIDYDVWFSEQSLYNDGEIEKALALLKTSGNVYESEGATWFKTTAYGCEKDDVLIRNNGIPTYFMGDIAYHLNKLVTRNFTMAVNVWGADHHGHIARLKAAMEAAGVNPERLHIVIMQLVRLLRDGDVARMSKRKGDMISLTDLIEEVGIDAARFFFNLRSPDSHLDFDLDLAIEQSSDNPVFYVQYAHARICSILRQMEDEKEQVALDYTLLVEKEEIALMDTLSRLPEELIIAENKYDPSRITRYAIDVASAFHTFYNACRVRNDDKKLQRARLCLINSTKQVLSNVLQIMGITAPEKM